jgi:glucose/arabinose dehydrogenase
MKHVTIRLAILAFALGLIRPTHAATPAIRLDRFVDGLEHPVDLQLDPAGRVFIVEQHGRIRLVTNGKLDNRRQPFLDIQDRVFDQGEMGLLGLALHPDFEKNGLFYVNYTVQKPKRKTIVSEFHVDPRATRADAKSERIVITIDQPFPNHNGGQVRFGPDGMLYIGMGDGGKHDDPYNNAQDPKSLLGKMLRIDVTATRNGYAIPKDNPYVGVPSARPEIFASGLRNPWRFSFDRKTGEIWTGDVGQNDWEEIDLITKGGDYGWRAREGFHQNPQLPGEPVNPKAIDPVLEYPHNKMTDRNLSITGGFVYRGSAIPALCGWYIYGDYASGRIWALRSENGKAEENVQLFQDWGLAPSAFGEDQDGELFVLAHERGVVLRIVPK